jgi:hypothetical protein
MRRLVLSTGKWDERMRWIRVSESPELPYGKSLTEYNTMSSWKDLLPRLQGERLQDMASDFL